VPERALIVGAGSGLSAALTRLFTHEGMAVAVAARDIAKLSALCAETGAAAYSCDASRRDEVDALFDRLGVQVPDIVVYNPSARLRGPIAELEPAAVEKALMVTCFGGFLVGRRAAQAMLTRGSGTILFTGASASVKGFALSAPFAMGKFGLRGLAQSMARELAPKNIHVGHIVIDGAIALPGTPQRKPDAMLDPQAIAAEFLHLHRQPRSAWTWEVELRPWTEPF
jgi:NAD(P)-dependent dehydrogenase (short-subunit alcohol dehydrogenase family)